MKNKLILLPVLLLLSCNSDSNKYDATGAFESTEVIVSAEASGRIIDLTISEGDRLSAGNTVGYIDSLQLHYKRQQLQSSVRTALSRRPDIAKQIASIEQEITTAEFERDRTARLVAAKSANRKQLDDAEAYIKVLQKQLSALKSNLTLTADGAGSEAQSIEHQISQIDDQLAKCRLRSPVGGTVLIKYAEAGEVASVGKPLYKIADTETMFLRAYITADQLTRLREGQQVAVYADFGDDRRHYRGTVTWVSDKSEFTPKGIQTKDERANLVYAVKIQVSNDGYLKIGQYGEVVFNSQPDEAL